MLSVHGCKATAPGVADEAARWRCTTYQYKLFHACQKGRGLAAPPTVTQVIRNYAGFSIWPPAVTELDASCVLQGKILLRCEKKTGEPQEGRKPWSLFEQCSTRKSCEISLGGQEKDLVDPVLRSERRFSHFCQREGGNWWGTRVCGCNRDREPRSVTWRMGCFDWSGVKRGDT
jgi:hypothetical protein